MKCRRKFARLCSLVWFLLFAQGMAIGSASAAPANPPTFHAAPANLSVPSLARTASTILLMWDKIPDPDVVAYDVYQDGVIISSTPGLFYTATNLAAATTYTFAVRARSRSGNTSAESNQIKAGTKSSGRVLNVREFGARGDGVTKDTAAIQKAIADCPPGGTVLIPPGKYLVDHLDLKSDLTLELSLGATLQFLGRKAGRYPTREVTLPGPDGEVSLRSFALISALRAKNLTITGGGVIRANGETWWPYKESPRPRVLQFIECADIFVQGVTIEDPPAWNTHVVYVDRAVFSEMKFLKVSTAHGSNGDGLNPDSSRDVLIVGCQFGNQDDSVAIKSGRVTPEQPRRQRSSENITIRDCLVDGTLAPGSHPLGFAVGSETCGGVRHVLIKDSVFRNAASVANIKANRERPGAVVEDIRVENCTYTNTEFGDEPWNRAPLTIDLFYYRLPSPPDSVGPLTPATPVFRDIHFKNIVIENPKGRFAYLCGLVEQPASGITFENVTGSARQGLHGQNLDGIELRNVTFNVQEGPQFEWINVQNRTVMPAAPAARWFKGNLHTHSLWSDGDDYPEMIADWYKQHGYQFLAISDHNAMQEGQRWLEPQEMAMHTGVMRGRGGGPALEKYLRRFGTNWVEFREVNGRREVRLKPLAEYRSLLEESGRFLMIPSEEISAFWGHSKDGTNAAAPAPIHINVTNLRDFLPPLSGTDAVETMQLNIDATLAQRERTGQAMFPHVNHPNFQWAVTAEELMQVRGERFFEVYNGHHEVNNTGDAAHLGMDAMWDVVLTRRLAELGLEAMFAVATDDTHHYHAFGPGKSNSGRGWVMVRARHLTAESIVHAMEAGDFYATTGATLRDVRREGRQLSVEIASEPGISYVTQFLGTRRGYDPRSEVFPTSGADPLTRGRLPHRRYSKDVGAVLAELTGTNASYTLKGDEIYVRAKIISSKPKANGSVPGEFETAWTQPLVSEPVK